MLKKVRENILTLKASRRKSGDGIETQMYDWMKLMFRIQQPAYHGGKLIGKDSVKMMGNAYEMFGQFKEILKANKKGNCAYSDPMIDEMCADFARLSVLWDGAFALASKVNPTTEDVQKYLRFVRGAVFYHQAMMLSITHKTHLSWAHIGRVMCLPGGLGQKREDWLEQQHQEGSAIRKQYRTTQNQAVRANAIAGAAHREFNPNIIAKCKEVNMAAQTGPRKDYTTIEDRKRLAREHNRVKELETWEAANQYIVGLTDGVICLPVGARPKANLPAVGEARVFNYD